MVKLKLALELNYEIVSQDSDFIFNIHLANTPYQRVAQEKLVLSRQTNIKPEIHTDAATGNRYMRLHTNTGYLKLNYESVVEINHYVAEPAQIAEVPIAHLPMQVLNYIYPSRYCQSDRLHKMAIREFGHLWQGYSRVQAIQEWVQKRVTYTPNTSDVSTSAIDTLIEQVGVCRDFAHLMIALCRAVNIPARFVTGTNYGFNPALSPPDFHAYVEVYLGDRWYIFDPSGTSIPMGFVRFGVGRDAADVPFATIFGSVNSLPPSIEITPITDDSQNLLFPHHCLQALSTAM